MENLKNIPMFAKFREYIKLTGLNVDTEIGEWHKMFLWIFPCILYFYTSIAFFRKWDFDRDIPYVLGFTYVLPQVTIVRFRRSTFASIIDLLERIDVCQMKDAAIFRDSLIKITPKVGKVACPFGSAAIPLVVVLWFIFGQHSDMPFNTLPAWLINYSYWFSLLLQVTVCSAICQEYVVLGAMKICFLLQLRMHFKHLKSNVQNILEVTETNEKIPWIYLQKKLKHLIDYHFSIIKIAEQVETLFNKCVLTGFVVLSVFVCISMYAILSNPLFGPDFWRFIFYIFMTFMPFFADCFFSQQVITESEELFSSYCEIDFVGTDLRFQKALLVLLGQGQRTIGFTIGKFAPLSIITIVTVLKTAFSYLTFLQNMKGE